MSRKDYKKIAESIAKLNKDDGFKAIVMDIFAKILTEDNPRFDYQQFKTACGE